MKNIAVTFVAGVLMLTSTGCASMRPSALYIKAERATHDSIAPEHLDYVNNDSRLTEGQKQIRRDALESWDERVTKAEEGLADD